VVFVAEGAAVTRSAWNILISAHDQVFLDRGWPLKVRREAAALLLRLSLEVGNAKITLDKETEKA
jgi:hypothetical protein